jgi:glycine/D-amino acid oxidase-like deaminating enzyme
MVSGATTAERADVLVIGGGIVGLSVAWQLRQLGVDRVVVFEAETLGSGSTGRAAGGVRRQFGSRFEIEMTLTSLDFFERLLADPEFPGRFESVGYAFLAGRDERAALEQALAIQREMGIATEWLEATDIAARFPYLETAGLVCGTYCPDDGFVNPWDVVAWLARRCRWSGVTIHEQAPVEAIDVGGGRVRGARSGALTVTADVVVNAAGAWAGLVGSLAGASIPVAPSPRVKLLTDLHPALPVDMPLIVDLPTGAYVRSERGHAMVGVKPDRPATGFQVDASPDLLAWMAERAAIRFPSLRTASLARVITGLYEVTPDQLPVVGAVPGLAGFFVVAGFNGHGIMHGPAAARALAEVIVRGRADVLDLERLRPDRFERPASGRPTETPALL